MKKCCFVFVLLLIACSAVFAQSFSLRGIVVDDKAQPLRGIAVSLLVPADSTLAFFGVSNTQGYYEISGVAAGNYVLQAAGAGYSTYYHPLGVPLPNGSSLPGIMLKAATSHVLDSVTVSAEKVPILFKKDTVEYNAGSFKTKPDAVVEELLRKLPGVEVDKAGNVKAHGKDVQKILVDGKEFFGDDPKVATKNLPADAIDKVQVYDALSDAAQFTGVDDGTRDKTINLKLKGAKRRGYFGDVATGGGTDDRYKLSAKLYRFQPKSQFALLGMLNNINQFGFSLQDYISFKGGLQGLMDGSSGGQGTSSIPLSGGGTEPGLITSGAAGINYTLEPRAGRRYNISYLGNGADEKLDEESNSQNFTPTETFFRTDTSNQRNRDFAHRLSINLRHQADSDNQLRLRGSASLTNGTTSRNLLSAASIRDAVLNRLDSRLYDDANGISSDATFGWIRRRRGSWPVISLSLNGGYDGSLDKRSWYNTTFYPATLSTIADNEYQHNERQKYRYGITLAPTHDLGRGNYLEPELRAGYDYDRFSRRQGLAGREDAAFDSLSRSFSRSYTWLRPGVGWRRSTKRVQASIALRAEEGLLDADAQPRREWHYLLPSASWQYTPGGGVTANLGYNAGVNAPAAQQMLPLTDYSNPVQRIHGNPLLQPEYRHQIFAGWQHYDAFSFTSLNVSLQGSYTRDRIGVSRSIHPDLSEDIYYVNTPDDYGLTAYSGYSTPLRRLGINFSASLNERYSRGQSFVNEVENINTTFTHGAKLTLSNRRQDKWSAELSAAGDFTDSRYSVQEALNSTFLHYNVTCSLSYKPSEAFYFSAISDVDRYTSRSFSDAVVVPLLNASASYYFLKGRRGVLSAEGFDLLDRNKAVRRISQLNYLLEQRSNIIGRYFMLSFKYRLSYGGGSGVKTMMMGK